MICDGSLRVHRRVNRAPVPGGGRCRRINPGTKFTTTSRDRLVATIDTDSALTLRREDFAGEEDLEGASFALTVLQRDFPDLSDDYGEQEAIARRVYDRLVKATDWGLVLAFEDGAEVVARRAPAASAA